MARRNSPAEAATAAGSTSRAAPSRRPLTDQLEDDFETVGHLRRELVPAEDKLEATRSRFWNIAGAPFGSVKLGGLRFSRLMVIVGGAFVAGVIGSMLAPVMALLGVLCALGAGCLWVRSKF